MLHYSVFFFLATLQLCLLAHRYKTSVNEKPANLTHLLHQQLYKERFQEIKAEAYNS